MDYLYAERAYSDRTKFPFPDLMLVDLNMPVMNGFEVLAAVGNRFEFQNLPIVVLSSNDDPTSIRMARKLGAREYILKPLMMVKRIKMVRGLHERWLGGGEELVPESQGQTFSPLITPEKPSGEKE